MHLRDGLSVMSPAGVCLDVNAALCEMTGFGHEELVGHGLPQPYSPPEHHDATMAAFRRLLDEDVASLEITFMRRSGERFPVLITPTVLRDAAGTPICLVATIKDVTQSERAERQLRESEARYRSLVEGMFDGLAYCRMHYDEAGRAVDWEYLP